MTETLSILESTEFVAEEGKGSVAENIRSFWSGRTAVFEVTRIKRDDTDGKNLLITGSGKAEDYGYKVGTVLNLREDQSGRSMGKARIVSMETAAEITREIPAMIDIYTIK